MSLSPLSPDQRTSLRALIAQTIAKIDEFDISTHVHEVDAEVIDEALVMIRRCRIVFPDEVD